MGLLLCSNINSGLGSIWWHNTAAELCCTSCQKADQPGTAALHEYCWGKSKVFSEHLTAEWESKIEKISRCPYLNARLILDWLIKLKTKIFHHNKVKCTKMHNHVTINGLWCSSILVQSLGWCSAHSLVYCIQAVHWSFVSLKRCFFSSYLL